MLGEPCWPPMFDVYPEPALAFGWKAGRTARHDLIGSRRLACGIATAVELSVRSSGWIIAVVQRPLQFVRHWQLRAISDGERSVMTDRGQSACAQTTSLPCSSGPWPGIT